MKTPPGKVRIDKWMWAVRLFKSRALASEACDKGKIRINDQPVKASRNIGAAEVISIRKGAFTIQVEVIKLAENRMAAKFVSEFYIDVTPVEELERMKQHANEMAWYRNRGEGRPTKKDRRDLENFTDW